MHKFSLAHRADVLGIIASSFCLVHCIATPLLIAMGAVAFTHPIVTYVFLMVAFLAIYKTTQKPTLSIIRFLLWFNFGAYAFATILHEMAHISAVYSYVFAALIILTHVSNIAYCKYCKSL